MKTSLHNRFFKFNHRFLFLKLLVAICFLLSGNLQQAHAQTKGLIVKPAVAGRAVLDKNNDGYVSATTAGFQNHDEVGESEIPFRPIAWPMNEPLHDLQRGPGGGFSDFSFISSGLHPVYTYTSQDGNLMFRFRLGSIAPNSKGYSILIDTDNKFGNTGSSPDPNYKPGNPGFEVEILLATNFGVYVFNVDGVEKPANGSQVLSYAYDDYSQKSIAWSTQGGDADYFYDFYVPFADLAAYFHGNNERPEFNQSTKIRMVANTVMSPHSALSGPISDIGGMDDSKAGSSPFASWNFIVTNQFPASSDTTTSNNLPPIRSAAPVVSAPLYAGSASIIRGTSSEPANTTITIYINGAIAGTTTVQSGGSWASNAIALTAGQTITATATAPNKSVSLLSNSVSVLSSVSSCTTSILPNILQGSGNNRGIQGTGAQPNAKITIYRSLGTGQLEFVKDTVANASGAWGYYVCNTGNHCLPCGTYYATQTPIGGCESALSAPYCHTATQVCGSSYSTSTAQPTISTITITSSTTSISGNAEATATRGATVYLYMNNPTSSDTSRYYLVSTTTAGTSTTGSGTWRFDNQTFMPGQRMYVAAHIENKCISPNSVRRTVASAPPVASTAPVVNSPIYNDATKLTGSSAEAAGTTITVLRNGTSIGTTTVDQLGNWSLTITSGTVSAGQNITATATASGKTVSQVSNTVVVLARPVAPAVPVVNGPLFEQGTTVSGTGPINTNINLYIDDAPLGSVTSDGSGNWQVNTLSAQYYDLYAGGRVYATAGTPSVNESATSASVLVQCNPGLPDRNKTISPRTATVCHGSTQTIEIFNSEKGVVYTLRNAANTADMGSSVLGNGGTIQLTTNALTASQTIRFNASRAESVYCSAVLLTDSVVVTVNPLPTTTLLTYASSVCSGSAPEITVENTQSGFSYQLRNNSNNAPIGSPVVSTGGTLKLTGTPITASHSYNILVTDITRPTNCAAQLASTATAGIGCPAVYSVQPAKSVELYQNDETLATVAAANSGIINTATILSGTLPEGATLNAISGIITVSNANALRAGSFPLTIRTTDSNGSTTFHNIILAFSSVQPLPVTLLSFTGQAEAGSVKLTWETASEKNSSYFDVERSSDGRTFQALGRVNAAGNSNRTLRYNFTDTNPEDGTAYYRLQQVDTDGSREFSKVIPVTRKATTPATAVFPNPFDKELQVNLSLLKPEQIEISVYDLSGKLLIQQQETGAAGTNMLKLNLGNLNQGVYQLYIRTETLQEQHRIVKY